jgi:hypothetical protein
MCAARVRCSIGRRAGFVVAERRCDALECRLVAAACSPWSGAPRCSTPWRYPTPKHWCVGAGRRCESGRCVRRRVSADGVRGRLRGRGCVGCVQYGGGGVVCMGAGAVKFKGGTISNTKAVSLRLSRFPFACCLLQMLMFCAAFPPTMLHAA